jgi:hypothetical protein
MNSCIVIQHNGLGDHINTISMCNYLLNQYDIVYHLCKEYVYKNVKLFYRDTNKIIVYKLNIDFGENFVTDILFNIIKNIYVLGFHQSNIYIKKLINKNIYGLTKKFNPNYIPYSFYEQVDINPNIFYEYMILPNYLENNLLYELIKDIPYYFISNNSSNGDTFSIDNIIKKMKINIDDILIINPVKNIYNNNHKYYNLANNFIMKPLIYYIKTIKNASKIILSNSCFMCLTLNIKCKTNDIYYISPHDYSYLFNENIIFKKKIHRLLF